MGTPSNRTAIVNGSSRGIGAAVAERLGKDGFNVNAGAPEARIFAVSASVSATLLLRPRAAGKAAQGALS